MIFDWDDTLVDSYAAIHAAINAARAAFGMEAWSLEEARHNCRRALTETFPEWFGADWHRARDVFYATFADNHLSLLKAMPGAEDLLDVLCQKKIPLAVCSNKNAAYLRQEISFLGWDRYFGAVAGAGDAPRGKPAPDGIYLICKQLGLKDDSVSWYVGDNDIDIQTAEAGSCLPIILGNNVSNATLGTWIPFGNCIELADIIRKIC